MRTASYLTASRHGIYYFRQPLPACLHPEEQTSDVKLSLGTRCPKLATRFSHSLILAGQALLSQPTILDMKYEDIRRHVQNHFRRRLANFKNQVNELGPISDDRVTALKDVIRAADGNRETFVNHTHLDDSEGLISAFCEQEGITEVLTHEDTHLILQDYQNAYRQHARAALDFNASFATFILEDLPIAAPKEVAGQHSAAIKQSSKDQLSNVAKQHIDEGQRSNLWVAKTVTEKRDALTLLTQLLKDKPIQDITKADARTVKGSLQKLPKNRNKSPLTKGLTLDAMLEVKGLPLTSVRTLNGYISHFQTFFKWAVQQGYAQENIFEGMRFRIPKRDKEEQRDSFTTTQLAIIFEHLNENPDGLVSKAEHKWVTLIAMFTGARLNEVAQLEVNDVQLHQGVWCLSFTTDGDANKKLKTEASRRLVPIHDKLLKCGVHTFTDWARERGQSRLFPSLSFDAQNGYGRNVGRWFNESFLVRLNMKKTTLSFHCLRHTMNTQLGQKNAPEHLQKAILGHTQIGMTYNTYFKDGFLPEQLQPEVNKFSF